MNSLTPCPGVPLSGCAHGAAPLRSGIRPMAWRMVLLGLILSLAFLGGQAKASFAAVIRVDALQQAKSLIPYFQFLPDSPTGLHIDEAASPALADRYQPLAQGIPHSFSGPVWLRLSLVKSNPGSSTEEDSRLLLDLGRDLPGTSRLFSVRKDTPEGEARLWQSEASSSHVVFSLPAPGMVPATIYIRLDAPPTPWFSPTLQAASAYTPPVLPLDLLLPALLAAALLMSLLRAQREKTQWRVWSALLTGAALLQAFFPVTALPVGPISPRMLCALLTPGFMLMLLPHMGRHLLQTPKTAPGVDAFLRLAPMLGAALVLAPLIPDLRWLGRYLALWPLLLLPLLPAAMRCLSRHIPGALAFFTACLAPVLGLAASLLELVNATPSLLGAGGHIWGMTLGCLALALASPGKDSSAEEENPDTVWAELPGLTLRDEECQAQDFATLADQAKEQRIQDTPFTDRQTADSAQAAPWDSENRQDSRPAPLPETFFTPEAFTPPANAALLQMPEPEVQLGKVKTPRQQNIVDESPRSLTLFSDLGQEQEEPCANPEDQDTPQDPFAEPGLTAARSPLAPCPLPSELYQVTPTQPVQEAQPEEPEQSIPWSLEPLQAPKREASLHAQLPSLENFVPANELAPLTETSDTGSEEHFFDLPRLLKETHAAVADMAEQKGLGLSWHVSPNIDQYYEGEGELLGETLTLLLRDAVRTATHGKIELTVRGLPGNANPGHLVFALSVRNGGTAMRPGDITAIGRAWALADRCGGFFSLDHTQDGDMSVVFSVQFAVPSHEAELDASQDIAAELEDPAPLAEPLVVEHIPVLEETPHSLLPTNESSLPDDAGGENTDQASESEQVAEYTPWVQERIILVDMAAGSRRLRAQYLSALPHTLLEADSIAAALDIFTRTPSGLMIFDADMPEADIVTGIAELRNLEQALSLPRTATLSLTAHDLQSERMLAAGSDETLVKPFSREQLQESVLRLAPSETAVPQQTSPTPEELLETQLTPPIPDTASPGVLADSELVALGLSAADIVPAEIDVPPASTADDAEAREEALPKATDAESEAMQAQEDTPEETAPPSVYEQALRVETIQEPNEPLEEKRVAQTASVRELPLLDLIITDIDPAEQEEAETPPVETAPLGGDRQDISPEQPVPVKQEKTNITATAEPSPPQATTEPQLVPARKTLPKPTVRISLREQVQSKIALSGVNDGVNADMLPFVPGLIYELGDAVTDALRGQEEKSCLLVQGAVERLAGKAAAFGLEGLERVARCVERAAAADDSDAVGDLLNELVALTERYKEALRLCHRNSL